MKTLDAIKQRRSVKHYDENFSIPEADVEKLIEALVLSPTSYNIQNWRFVRVKDRALREQMKEAAWGQEQVSKASELFIFCADNNAWNDRPERYWANADQKTRDILLPMINSFYKGKEQTQRDEAMRSCGIAAQTLMIAAKSIGYDSCPMIGYNTEEVARLINLPTNHVIAMMVVIGKASIPAHPRSGQLHRDEILINDHF